MLLVKPGQHIRTPLARLRYRVALLLSRDEETLFSADIDHVEQLVNELLFKASIDTHGTE